MVIGILHKGSGLGDQLFSYIATRVRAKDLGVDFGFVGKEFFKGADFMNLDWGKEYDIKYHVEEQRGKLIVDEVIGYGHHMKLFEINKPYYDPEFNFIYDYTIIDGYGAQDERYFEHRMPEVREWLKVEPIILPSDLCIINLRGGEFRVVDGLFLTQSYWNEAIGIMKDKGIKKFHVVTDDPIIAEKFFPDYFVSHEIGRDWRMIRYAKNLIISNSAFAILPALLGESQKTIAPRGWAKHNNFDGEWGRPNNYYKRFTYV